MAFSGGGIGGGMATRWNQQRSLRYLSDGKPDISHTLALVWKSLRVYRWQLILGTFVMVLGVGVGLIRPLLIREMIDVVIPEHQFRLIHLLGVGLVLFPVWSALLGLGQNYLSIVIAQGMIAALRDHLYRHVQSLGLDFFTWSRAGEIHTRFLNDAGGLQNVLTQSPANVVIDSQEERNSEYRFVKIDRQGTMRHNRKSHKEQYF